MESNNLGHSRNTGPQSMDTAKTHITSPISEQNQNNETPAPDIDDHVVFWSTYDKVAGTYDAELLDGWNKSLDILLIFAALFSAINTAFIVESQKSLQPDPMEITNSLLRLLIVHRADNVTLSQNDLHPGSVNPSGVSINSIFFTSLSFSLSAAFGAVTAKQWLTEYTNVGSIKALHIQGRERQAKFTGLEKWHLPFVMDLLPMMLQLSVLVFLIGIVQFIWSMNRKVATIELVLSAVGVGIYVTTVIIGVVIPTSPFRTPLSKYLHRTWIWLWCMGKNAGRKLEPHVHKLSSRYPFRFFVHWLERRRRMKLESQAEMSDLAWQMDDSSPSFFITLFHIVRHGWRLLRRGVITRYVRFLQSLPIISSKTRLTEWSCRDILAAGSVVWLLEHSEHADTTIAALDAALRLPSDLVLILIDQREGLRDRLIMFHLSLVPLSSYTGNPGWRDRATISEMALFHLFKFDKFSEYKNERSSFSQIPVHVQGERKADMERIESALSEPTLLPVVAIKWSSSALHDTDSCQALSKPTKLQIEITEARQNSVTNSIVTSVVPVHLILEALACATFLGHMPPISIVSWEKKEWSGIVQGLQTLLETQPSRSTISYVALAVAAIHWMIEPEQRAERWCYPSDEQERQFEKMLKRSIYALDKGKLVLDNVALALSLVDPSSPDRLPDLLHSLLSLTEDAFCELLKEDHQTFASRFPHLAESLLQLSRRLPEHKGVQGMVLRVLGRCRGWVSSSTVDYVDDIIRLFTTHLDARHDDSSHLTSSSSITSDLYKVTTELVSMPEDDLFRYVFLSSDGLLSKNRIWPWPRIRPIYSGILNGTSFKFGGSSSVIRSSQIDIALEWLVHLHRSLEKGGDQWQNNIEPLAGFLQGLFTQDAQLRWPAYFPPDFIETMDLRKRPEDRNKFIAKLKAYGLERVWIGDIVLMLWVAAHHARKESWLPEDWDDKKFFELVVMDLMLSHYHYLIEQRFECVDHKTLGTYFQNAFLKEQNRLGLGPKGSKPDEGEEQRPSHGFQSSRNRGRRLLVLEDPPENLTTKAPIPTPEQLKRYNKIREILESLGLPIS